MPLYSPTVLLKKSPAKVSPTGVKTVGSDSEPANARNESFRSISDGANSLDFLSRLTEQVPYRLPPGTSVGTGLTNPATATRIGSTAGSFLGLLLGGPVGSMVGSFAGTALGASASGASIADALTKSAVNKGIGIGAGLLTKDPLLKLITTELLKKQLRPDDKDESLISPYDVSSKNVQSYTVGMPEQISSRSLDIGIQSTPGYTSIDDMIRTSVFEGLGVDRDSSYGQSNNFDSYFDSIDTGGFGSLGSGSYGLDLGCPVPSTKILMAGFMLKAAGDLKVGDLVYTFHEKNITEWGIYPVAAVEKTVQPAKQIVFTDGESISVSNSHVFFLKNATEPRKFAENLAVGDIIRGRFTDKIVQEIIDLGVQEVMKIEIASAHTYIAADTYSHNVKYVDSSWSGGDSYSFDLNTLFASS